MLFNSFHFSGVPLLRVFTLIEVSNLQKVVNYKGHLLGKSDCVKNFAEESLSKNRNLWETFYVNCCCKLFSSKYIPNPPPSN